MVAAAANGTRAEHAFFNIVGGECRAAKEQHRVTNPRTEEELAWDVPIASKQDLDDAVRVARQAFKTWRKTTVAERQAVITAVSKVLKDNAELLSSILLQETGKSKLMAEHEIQGAAGLFNYYTTVQLEDEIQFEDDEVKIVAKHAPYGVIGAISPWNFPLILSTVKVASALATGNCVIIKPSPFTPYAILKFCELAQAVVPHGVFQALNGGADLGEAMTLHPGIEQISFTGTIAVGKRIMANCAQTLKRVILELAGNDAAIVTDDIDVAKTAPMVALGCFLHAGQMCVASKRVYVHEKVYDEFLAALVKVVEEMCAISEDPATPTVFGPLSNRANFERCQGFIEDCRKNGYKFVTGGDVRATEKGFWIAPTIISNPPEDSLLVREEQFGPVVPVLTWSDEEDVIARANLDNAGLGGAVFCRDVDRAQRIAGDLETGTVWINRPEQPHPGAFFAGQKLSGVGGELGKQGLLSYCHTRSFQIAKK